MFLYNSKGKDYRRKILGLAITGIKTFTKNGCRLLSKQTKVPVSEMKGFTIPENSDYANIVKAATNFGEGSTSITTFFDKDGHILQRLINKNKGSNVEDITSVYDGCIGKSTQKFLNGELKQKVYSYDMYNPELKQLARQKLTMDIGRKAERTETQILEKLAPQSSGIYLKTTLRRDVDGRIINKNIESNFVPEEKLQELSKSPYLYFRTYEDKEFVEAICPYAKKLQQVEDRNPQVILKELEGNNLGEHLRGLRLISIDIPKHHSNKSALIDTLNHELRHEYQEKLIEHVPDSIAAQRKSLDEAIAQINSKIESNKAKMNEGFFKRLMRNWGLIKEKPVPVKTPTAETLTPEEKALAEKLAQNYNSYIKPEEDYTGYYNQIMETDARKAGSLAAEEFEKESAQITALFSGATGKLHNWNEKQIETQKILYDRINKIFEMYK